MSAKRIASFDPAQTIEKLLRRAKRSVVQLLEAIQETKAHAELRMQCLRAVTNDIEAAGNTPLEEITYPLVRRLIQTRQREGLSRKSIKNLFGILRAIYNFQFDEMTQHGKPIVSPWLVK